MSNPTVLQSRNVPFAIGTDGVTYKTAVCKKAVNVAIEPQITQEESDCGTHTAVGSTRWSFDAEVILNTTPNGATEVSINTIAGYANAGTTVYVKLVNAGTYYRQGSGIITNYRETLPLNGFVTASFTFTGDGTLDLSE
jgi:hypothetical protein